MSRTIILALLTVTIAGGAVWGWTAWRADADTPTESAHAEGIPGDQPEQPETVAASRDASPVSLVDPAGAEPSQELTAPGAVSSSLTSPAGPATEDVDDQHPIGVPEDSEALAERESRRIGRTPAIDPSNPAAAPVIEALITGNYPERLSIVHAPVPFDPVEYAQDPQPYLAGVEPGRVFQVADPGPEVPVLTALVAQDQEVIQGGWVPLAVRTAPGAPVTFTSLDLGIFRKNGLAAITVAADGEGVASVELVAGPGTVGEVTTLAGSPAASGQVRFLVTVVLDEAAQDPMP